jgi:uncharacterized damage-inducible protein DinB
MFKTLSVLLFAGCAFAQSQSAGRIFESQLRTAESEIVPLVEAMPADKIDFAPTAGEFKGVRTFGEQGKHIAAVLYMVCSAAKGEKPPVDIGKGENGPDNLKTREQIAKFMKDAFTYARAAAASLTAENLTEMVPSPFGQGKMAKGALIDLATWHSFDHYGQMVVYARMNGIIPPASRPR